MVKKLLLTGLAALVMAFSPSCDDGGDNGNNGGNGGNGQTYECYVNDHCLDNETCEDGYCVEKQEQECGIKENLQPEDFNGTYEVMESFCSNKYSQITFEGEDDTFDVGAIDKKTGEFVCLDASADPNVNGNYLSSSSHNFIKCDDLVMKMKWYDGGCEAWLEKTSNEPLPEINDYCN